MISNLDEGLVVPIPKFPLSSIAKLSPAVLDGYIWETPSSLHNHVTPVSRLFSDISNTLIDEEAGWLSVT